MEWNNVNEKLPEMLEEVIVYTGLHNGSMNQTLNIAFRIESHCGGWKWHFKKETTEKVYFWHPLPKLPK